MIARKGSRTLRTGLFPFSLPAALPFRKLYHSGRFWLQVKKTNLQLQSEILWASGEVQQDPWPRNWGQSKATSCLTLAWVTCLLLNQELGQGAGQRPDFTAAVQGRGEKGKDYECSKEVWRDGQLSKPSSPSSRARADRPYFPAFSDVKCGQAANGTSWHGPLKTSHPQPFMFFPPLRACPFRHGVLGGDVLQMAEPPAGRNLSLWITTEKSPPHTGDT